MKNQVIKQYQFIFFSLFLMLFSLEIAAQKTSDSDFINQMNNYNVVWNSQSKNSSESMPLGGGDMGLNVWVKESNRINLLKA